MAKSKGMGQQASTGVKEVVPAYRARQEKNSGAPVRPATYTGKTSKGTGVEKVAKYQASKN